MLGDRFRTRSNDSRHNPYCESGSGYDPPPSRSPFPNRFRDSAQNLQGCNQTNRNDYYMAREAQPTPSPSEYTQTSRNDYYTAREAQPTPMPKPTPSELTQTSRTETNTVTDLPRTGHRTGNETLYTDDITERRFDPRRQASWNSVNNDSTWQNPVDARFGRLSITVKAKPSKSNLSEYATSVSTNRGSIASRLRSRMSKSLAPDLRPYRRRFQDLQLLCPPSFRPQLKTWEQYAARSHKAGHDADPSDWFHCQRSKVMNEVYRLDEYYEERRKEVPQEERSRWR